MAGSWPDVPAQRIPYDADASTIFRLISGALAGSLMTLTDLNDDTSSGGQFTDRSNTCRQGVVFSRPWDLYGAYTCVTDGTSHSFWYSTDTTTGADGTWTSVSVYRETDPNAITTTSRNSITTFASPLLGVKGVAVQAVRTSSGFNAIARTIHAYGVPSTSPEDHLRFWHPTLDQQIGGAYFDWGDLEIGTGPHDRTFRIKNASSTLTANSVVVSMESLPPTVTPTLQSWHSLSSDGVTFGATASAGTLAAGAISGVLTLRASPPSNADLTVRNMRLRAVAGSWA